MVVHTVVEPVSIHILWQTPQYVIMTAGEVSSILFDCRFARFKARFLNN